MDIPSLRGALRPFVGGLKDSVTNALIPALCIELGLPVPPEGGKRDRMHMAFDQLANDKVADFARKMVAQRRLAPALRNEVQDLLWADEPVIELPKKQRRDVARSLQKLDLFKHWDNFSRLLQDVFVIQDDFHSMFYARKGVLDDIYQHFVANPEDANVETLWEQLKVFELSDRRFAMLLEGLTSADVQVDTQNQLEVVSVLNPVLRDVGAELRQTGDIGGYPVFSLHSMRSARGRPKNLIFASPEKPDIRFRDAVDNDIEIVSNAEACLVYDRPLGSNGLKWRDLQEWWAETRNVSDPELAKRTLYKRLLEALPDSSPPQRFLFESYFRTFGTAIPDLPAMLPEVWLHWDPQTVSARGAQALLNQRMDFLLLVPGNARVVLEVDGAQHYSDASGKPSPRQYARLTASDRDLKLVGYEVYRFAGYELVQDNAADLVKDFFVRLLKRHGLTSALATAGYA